jgi:phosphoglycerol transferase MdoB-like AlkP superfamily enzyme
MTLRRVPDRNVVIAGHGRVAMPPAIAFLANRLAATELVARDGFLRFGLLAILHLIAIAIMAWSEAAIVPKLVFLLTWGLLNFFWLALLRRPAVAAALSLVMIVLLVVVSRLKYDIIWMTANFLDVMIVDHDTVAFLLTIIPGLYLNIIVALTCISAVLAVIWYVDKPSVRRSTAAIGFAACLVGITGVSLADPQEDWEAFFGDGYVSKFARSGVGALYEFTMHGYMESDAVVTDRLKTLPEATCTPVRKPPHIIMVHDESSFDIRVAPGVKVPAGYGPHFRSFDGKERHFIVEGAGGPSWYTEYNVLAGLSARSFGRFAYFVTRIAAGRVERGLPTALRRCGYHTFSIYPALGAFMSARSFQQTTGMQRFLDSNDLGTTQIEPDSFY